MLDEELWQQALLLHLLALLLQVNCKYNFACCAVWGRSTQSKITEEMKHAYPPSYSPSFTVYHSLNRPTACQHYMLKAECVITWRHTYTLLRKCKALLCWVKTSCARLAHVHRKPPLRSSKDKLQLRYLWTLGHLFTQWITIWMYWPIACFKNMLLFLRNLLIKRRKKFRRLVLL